MLESVSDLIRNFITMEGGYFHILAMARACTGTVATDCAVSSEDLAHEAIVKALASHQAARHAQPRAIMRRCVRSLSIDYWRRSRYLSRCDEELYASRPATEPTPEDVASMRSYVDASLKVSGSMTPSLQAALTKNVRHWLVEPETFQNHERKALGRAQQILRESLDYV